MLVGVVSDTHNNINNIKSIIDIFNKEEVDLVIHTGDISKPNTLKRFADLNCELIGVFGNNDRIEIGLEEVCREYNFNFKEPPLSVVLNNRNIAVFHEPEIINEYINNHENIDLIIHGHTHRYREEEIEGVIYFNPGESAGSLKGKNAIGIINLNYLEIKRIFF
tara:strand:- start:125 stop:616 length:492 start_codon:yes stop_codon:yes gene_type:complete